MPKVKKNKFVVAPAQPATPVQAPATERPICPECHVRYVRIGANEVYDNTCLQCWEKKVASVEPEPQPERILKILQWDPVGRCGLVWFAHPGKGTSMNDVYSFWLAGTNAVTFRKVIALANGSSGFGQDRFVGTNAQHTSASCNCPGYRGHGKCKHASAAMALLKEGGLVQPHEPA